MQMREALQKGRKVIKQRGREKERDEKERKRER